MASIKLELIEDWVYIIYYIYYGKGLILGFDRESFFRYVGYVIVL